MPRWKSSETTVELPAIEIEKTIEKDTPFLPMSGNKIYFYSDVTRESIYGLNKQIDEITKHLKTIQFNYGLLKAPVIELFISSEGGDVFPTMASVDKIINNPIPIHTHCEGIVASAATLISVVGKTRTITPNSTMLIHQCVSGFWGNYQEFKDEIQNLDFIMSLIKRIYIKYTKFTEADLDDLLKHDLCLNSDQCLEKGLVDKVC
jgi:ATP-dependent Clp protease protease subunit